MGGRMWYTADIQKPFSQRENAGLNLKILIIHYLFSIIIIIIFCFFFVLEIIFIIIV